MKPETALDSVALLVEVRDLLRSIDARLARTGTPVGTSSAHPDPGALLHAIAQWAGQSVAFSVAELVSRCESDSDLHAAVIAACGTLNARKIGKLLARLVDEGKAHDGLVVSRIGADGSGTIWSITAT